ncbi:AGE family epimerase/isomerase [Fodinicola acaciae]|uniref:AGE family epimerase/isomerase n=1 Tax=Fodinicola acaciae TaxID=2681555 RepID=UPI0013D8241D|nr:AGE family epimerase/isomerase [Fodinicola acaciae]
MTPHERISAAAAEDLRHLNAQVLPWWFDNGSDDDRGGVFTCFSNDGELVSTDKYTWSQGRWAWLTGAIATSDFPLYGADKAAERAARTADFLVANAILPDDSTIYQLTADGRPVKQPDGSLHSSLYADLFVVLGLAGAAVGNTGDPRCPQWTAVAAQLLESAGRRVRDGAIRTEPYPVPDGMTSLAVGMMMLSAATALFRATQDSAAKEVALSHADELIRGAADAVPADFAYADRRPAGTLMARHRTPGHVLEMLWFLVDTADALPEIRPKLGDWMVRRAVESLRLGWDEQDGGLFRFVDRDGGPPVGDRIGVAYEELVDRTWSTKLWWPHAESLYATALLASRFESGELMDWHDRIRDYTYATFPAPQGREWIQIRDRRGAPLDQVVGLPVKDPFHVARALLLSAKLRKENS